MNGWPRWSRSGSLVPTTTSSLRRGTGRLRRWRSTSSRGPGRPGSTPSTSVTATSWWTWRQPTGTRSWSWRRGSGRASGSTRRPSAPSAGTPWGCGGSDSATATPCRPYPWLRMTISSPLLSRVSASGRSSTSSVVTAGARWVSGTSSSTPGAAASWGRERSRTMMRSSWWARPVSLSGQKSRRSRSRNGTPAVSGSWSSMTVTASSGLLFLIPTKKTRRKRSKNSSFLRSYSRLSSRLFPQNPDFRRARRRSGGAWWVRDRGEGESRG